MKAGKEEFELPQLSVDVNEQALLMIAKNGKKMSNEEFGSILNRYRLLKCLQKVDDKVKVEHINNMHPDDFYILLADMLKKGREIEEDMPDFR